jgi:hypothetical protein
MEAILVSYEGEKISIKELSRRTGVNYQTLIYRYHQGKRGKDLISPQKHDFHKLYQFRGKKRNIEEIAAILGKKTSFVYAKYRRYGDFNFVDQDPPPQKPKGRVLCEINGVAYKASDLTRLLGLSRQRISQKYLSLNIEGFTGWVTEKLNRLENG